MRASFVSGLEKNTRLVFTLSVRDCVLTVTSTYIYMTAIRSFILFVFNVSCLNEELLHLPALQNNTNKLCVKSIPAE